MVKPTTTIYADMIAAGVGIDHHESDLYVPNNAETRAILRNHGAQVDAFQSAFDESSWFDIPFAYLPWFV